MGAPVLIETDKKEPIDYRDGGTGKGSYPYHSKKSNRRDKTNSSIKGEENGKYR